MPTCSSSVIRRSRVSKRATTDASLPRTRRSSAPSSCCSCAPRPVTTASASDSQDRLSPSERRRLPAADRDLVTDDEQGRPVLYFGRRILGDVLQPPGITALQQ